MPRRRRSPPPRRRRLDHLVRVVLRRIVNAPGSTTLPNLAFTGSIMEKVQPVRDALIAAVRSEFPTIHTLEGVIDPIAGALWRAPPPARA